jgi:hypothetical protein
VRGIGRVIFLPINKPTGLVKYDESVYWVNRSLVKWEYVNAPRRGSGSELLFAAANKPFDHFTNQLARWSKSFSVIREGA